MIRELGIGLVAYSPLGRGFLTGAVEGVDALAPDDIRRRQPRFTGANLDHNLELLARVRELAAEHSCTPAQLALAWVLHQGKDVVPIPGTKRPRYVEENAAAVEIELSAEDLQRIDEALPVGSAAGERYADMSIVNR